jgi:hypothetical protein
MSITSVQYSGILNKEIQPIEDLEERINQDNKLKKKFDDEKEEIISIGKTDLRQAKEYNLNGHYREDYDTKKQIDKFA